MKEIFVYVEGPSDKLSMERLLEIVIERGRQMGNTVTFHHLEGKTRLLNRGPLKALNILRNKPRSWVFLVPDLYPKNMPFPHLTFEELKQTLVDCFVRELNRKKCDMRLAERFRIHCFKHDLEALLLASESALLRRLETVTFSCNWCKPVEDQNHGTPPKLIVEKLFEDTSKHYKETVDAPWILERSDYRELMRQCPQHFKPFVEDLMGLIETGQT